MKVRSILSVVLDTPRLHAGLVLLALSASGCASSNTNMSGLAFWRSEPKSSVRTRADHLHDLRELAKSLPTAGPSEQQKATVDIAQAIRNERDPILRAQMLRTLGACDTAGAKQVLLAGVNDSDAMVRIAACESLGQRGGADGIQALAQVLGSDADIDVRLAAAKGLGDTGDAAAVASLSLALEDPNPALQLRGVRSLEKVTGKDFGDDVVAWRTFCQGGTPEPRSQSIASRVGQLF